MIFEYLNTFLYGSAKPADIETGKDKSWVPAVEYFYNKLTPAEKKQFDLFERMVGQSKNIETPKNR
jgi:hypothetical protein